MQAILDRILEQADSEDVFGMFAAGPLEAFIEDAESRLEWIERRAAESPRFKEALSRV